MSEFSIEVNETPVVVEVAEAGEDGYVSVEISNTGPQGAVGPQGAPGPQGPAGAGSFVYTQALPDSVWTIVHPLGGFPNVTVIDSAGTVVEGEIAYPDSTTLVLTFAAAFSGTAYLS